MALQYGLSLVKGGRQRRAPIAGRARSRRTRWAYIFMIPFTVGMLGLVIGPMATSLYLSTTDFDLLSSPNFVGLDNYIKLFTDDPRYLHSIVVTTHYVLLTVPLKLAVALGIAVMLRRTNKVTGFYRTALYLPSLLGGSVAIAVMWQRLFAGDGVINNFFRLLGWENPPAWVNEPDHALKTLVALALWEFGAPMIIFLAGLQQIPPQIYEAATVDGASRFKQLTHITLPLLSPVIFFNLVMGTIGAYKSFTPAYVVSGGNGGPLDSTLMYGLYLYQEGFTNFRMGYASAMAWVLIAILLAVTAALFASARWWVHYEN